MFAAVLAWDAHFTLKMTFAQIAAPGLIQGIGLPCFFIPLTAATLSRIPDDRLAAASSLSNFLRTLSAAFGTAMSVTLWDNRATYHYDVVSQSVTHASANTQRFVHTLNAMGVDGVRELSTLPGRDAAGLHDGDQRHVLDGEHDVSRPRGNDVADAAETRRGGGVRALRRGT